MANAKRKVAVAVAAAVSTPEVTPGTFVSLNGRKVSAKVTVAPAMTAAQQADYDMGYALGLDAAEHEQTFIDALVTCNNPARRIMLRHGYCEAYMSAPRIIRKVEQWPTLKQAENRFDYLAGKHAPAETSRQAKSNAERKRKPGGGRKTKVAFTAKKGERNDADVLKLVLAYVKAKQKAFEGDSDVMEMCGDIARIIRTGK